MIWFIQYSITVIIQVLSISFTFNFLNFLNGREASELFFFLKLKVQSSIAVICNSSSTPSYMSCSNSSLRTNCELLRSFFLVLRKLNCVKSPLRFVFVLTLPSCQWWYYTFRNVCKKDIFCTNFPQTCHKMISSKQ